jgi:class 3 adenylate cyclase
MAGQGRRGLRAAAPRDLRTVLFTDIVGSTEVAARLGDRAYGALLARHHALIRDALRTHAGREVDTAGDGFFATFGRPTAALACARAIVTGVHDLGLAVRVGVHFGEVETLDGKAGGISVHLAARLMAAAGPDEVLLSATVHDLVAGAGWTFADRGVLTLKGLAEPVHAYALDLSAPAPSLARGLGPWASLAERVGGPWVLGAGALVVLLAAGLLGLTLAGGTARPSAAPTRASTALAAASPRATPALAATSTPGASPAVGMMMNCGGGNCAGAGVYGEMTVGILLTPGTYAVMPLPGMPTLTMPDNGWAEADSGLNYLILARMTTPGDLLTIQWTDSLSTDVCGYKPQVTVGAEPEQQFAAWAQANKGLRLSAGIPRQFGDLLTTEYDVSVVARDACQYTSPVSVVVNEWGGGPELTLFAGDRQRFEVASRNEKLILILISARSEADFDTFEPLAEQVLDSLTWPPSPTQ